MEGPKGPSSLAEKKKKKKNRRKITRKSQRNLPAIPSSSNQEDQVQADDEMPEASSSHAPEKNPLSELKDDDDDDDLMIDINTSSLIQQMSTAAPVFAPVKPSVDKTTSKSETRRVSIPPHRMTPLKKDWLNIFGSLTEILGLQVRMNVQRRCVEIRVHNLFPCVIEEY